MLIALLSLGAERPLDAAMAHDVFGLTLGSEVFRNKARNRPMSMIGNEDSDAPTSFGRLIFLLAVPAIALTLMAALALQQESPRRQPASDTAAVLPASGTSAPPSARFDPDYTLYIMDSADDAQHLSDLSARGPGLDWYAYVSTREEEAELIRAREEADWFRYAGGLPSIRVVDLRFASPSPTSAHAAMP